MRNIAIALGLLVLALFAAPLAHADHVYKCKGASGETIYQNDPCPDGATTIAHGTYDRQPDNPRNNIEATNAAADANEQREYNRQAANAASGFDEEPEHESEYARQTRERREHIEAGSYRSRVGHSGPAKVQGDEIARRPTMDSNINGGRPVPLPSDTSSSPQHAAAAPSPAMHMTQAPPPPQQFDNSDCRRSAGGNVTCWDSQGNASTGHTDPSGHTGVYGKDGQWTRLPNDTCIKDNFGNCKK